MQVLSGLSSADEESLALQGLESVEQPWVFISALLWQARRRIALAALAAFAISTVVAFSLPKQYESTARIMPPEQPGGGAAMLAALSGHAMPAALSALAGGVFGIHNSGALFVTLLESESVQEHLVDQFDLQKVYSKRYRVDALKKLSRRTEVTEDHKSGVITITVTDNDRRRARDLAQAYLDQLDSLLVRV